MSAASPPDDIERDNTLSSKKAKQVEEHLSLYHENLLGFMMERGGEEFATTAGGNLGGAAATILLEEGRKDLRKTQLRSHKEKLFKAVTDAANRPEERTEYEVVAPSPAYEALQSDYRSQCDDLNHGGLSIVYSGEGAGKSYAMQAVARAKSVMQPRRFLVLNQFGSYTYEQLYQNIKHRVLGIHHFDCTPTELAEVIQYGLCGRTGGQFPQTMHSLPKTDNKCRINLQTWDGSKPQILANEKTKDYPILVIDEFNPSDFKWERDFSIHDLAKEMGEVFDFFMALTAEAYKADGFVVLVGTKCEAVARALLTINGGSKAYLAPATVKENRIGRPFTDWVGFRWSAQDKEKVVRVNLETQLKKVLRNPSRSEGDVESRATQIILEECSKGENIRATCQAVQKAIEAERQASAVVVQMGTMDDSPTQKKWWDRCFCGSS